MICHNRHGIEVTDLPVAAGRLKERQENTKAVGAAVFHGDKPAHEDYY